MTKIIKCNCEHKFQDETYGKYMRVHNSCGKIDNKTTIKYRCSVCNNIKQ